MVGRYLSFGPVLPPGNVVLQVFHLEIMRKLQQLLFLGTRRREIGVKKMGDTVLILEGSGQSWRLRVAGQVRRSSKEMQRGRMETLDAQRDPGGVLEQEWAVPEWEAGGERAAGAPAGGPTWQSIMASSSFSSIFFSPVSAHRRASRTGPSGRLPSFFRGASQSGDKTTGRSSGEVVPGRPVKLPGWGNHALCRREEALPLSTSHRLKD